MVRRKAQNLPAEWGRLPWDGIKQHPDVRTVPSQQRQPTAGHVVVKQPLGSTLTWGGADKGWGWSHQRSLSPQETAPRESTGHLNHALVPFEVEGRCVF